MVKRGAWKKTKLRIDSAAVALAQKKAAAAKSAASELQKEVKQESDKINDSELTAVASLAVDCVSHAPSSFTCLLEDAAIWVFVCKRDF